MIRRTVTVHTAAASLFERLDGEAGVARLVDRFYARLWADAALAPSLAALDPDALKPAQVAFFVEALGGAARPRSADRPAFDAEQAPLLRIALHLYDAVMSLPIAPDIADEALLAILTHALEPDARATATRAPR